VPFTSEYAGKIEDKLKTDTTKTKHNPEKANNTKHSKTKLPLSDDPISSVKV